jgi:O-methyltransferase
MTDSSGNPEQGLCRRIARKLLVSLVRRVGSKRMLRIIQSVDPSLVGTYSQSDYPRHLRDAEFGRVEKLTRDYTLVDSLRRHELWLMVRQCAKLGNGDFLEVGVWRGGTGLLIAEAMRQFNASGTLYLADTFRGVVKAGEHDSSYSGGEHADTTRNQVENLFAIEKHDVKILEGIFPEETGYLLAGSLKFIHIDVDVYQSARDIVGMVLRPHGPRRDHHIR